MIPSADEEARIRFTYRVHATGDTYGAPAGMVDLATREIEDMKAHGLDIFNQISSTEFRTLYINTHLGA